MNKSNSRRNFLKTGLGLVGLVASNKIIGCSPSSSSSSGAVAQPKQFPLAVLEQRFQGQAPYGGNSTHALQTGERYDTKITFVPQEDINDAVVEARLYDNQGNLDSKLQSGLQNFIKDSVVPNPSSFVLRTRKDNTEFEYHLVTNPGTPQENRQIIPGTKINIQPTGTPPVRDSEHIVQEALELLDCRYSGNDRVGQNSNPGLYVVHANAPSADEGVAATNLRTGLWGRMSKHVTNPTVEIATESNAVGKPLRVYVGTPASVQEIQNMESIVGTIDKPLVFTGETPNFYGLFAAGSTPAEAKLAAELLQNARPFNLTQSNKYEVSGTSGNLTVTPV